MLLVVVYASEFLAAKQFELPRVWSSCLTTSAFLPHLPSLSFFSSNSSTLTASTVLNYQMLKTPQCSFHLLDELLLCSFLAGHHEHCSVSFVRCRLQAINLSRTENLHQNGQPRSPNFSIELNHRETPNHV